MKCCTEERAVFRAVYSYFVFSLFNLIISIKEGKYKTLEKKLTDDSGKYSWLGILVIVRNKSIKKLSFWWQQYSELVQEISTMLKHSCEKQIC